MHWKHNKKNRLIYLVAVFVFFAVFFAIGFYEDHKKYQDFINEEYSGVVQDIKYVNGNRGYPYVKIGEEWIVFGKFESKIENRISISDSIVKIADSENFKIFKKNDMEQWDEQIVK